ncbi:MAG: hypothetical protein AAGA30_16375 [Planctomycetota bacterium]
MALTSMACVVLVFFLIQLDRNLRNSSYVSGYILLGSIVFLTAFNMRKRLTFLPSIGSAALWMQLHIYVGLSTFVVFGFHISWRIPNGHLEGFLACLYMIVALSGVYGLIITRLIPKRLTSIGEEVIFERIPSLRRQMASDVRLLAMGGVGQSNVIPKFYLNRLLPFFERPRGFGSLCLPSGRRKRRLLTELNDLQRYLSDEQRQVSSHLSTYINLAFPERLSRGLKSMGSSVSSECGEWQCGRLDAGCVKVIEVRASDQRSRTR